MKQIRPIIFLLFGSLFILSSCISNKHVALFQNANLEENQLEFFPNQDTEYQLQARDVLAIRVKSVDDSITDYLNLQAAGGSNDFNGQLSTFMTGFSISDSGYIHLPVLGKIKVAGLTVEEARATLQRRIDEDLIDATVIMNLVSFKVSVLGEVNQPGYYHLYNNRATILDALALSGGMNEFADRQDVMIIRQKEDGSEATSIDLTNAELLKSPFYYLRPNDAIIIKPLSIKHQRSNLANLNIVGVAISGISTAVSIITVIELLKN